MKKKLFCLLMAVCMLCPMLSLVSCSDESEATVEDMSERAEIYMTLYTITDEKTTEKGIERVQKALDDILYDRYKTHIVLKCFTADEYDAELQKLYDEFAVLEEERLKEEAREKEEAKRIAEEEKSLSKAEKRRREDERRKAEAEAEAQAELEEQERLQRIKDGLEDPISGPQLDILYLPSADAYYSAIAEEQILPLDSYMKVDFKEIYTYLSNNLLTNATLSYDEADAALYGLPNNGPIASDGWYYVINSELAEKHNLDVSDTTPQLSDFVEYAHIIAEKEPGVIPFANPAPVSDVDFYEDIPGFPISANNSEFGAFEARGVMQTYGANSIARTHFGYMAELREAGYFADRKMTTADNFFVDIRQGTADDVAQWQKEGYTVLTYRRPATEIAACRTGFYAISSFCAEDYQERAMEVLQALFTNPEVHNTYAFGVEGVDYQVNEDGITVTLLENDSPYLMDFATTGNTLLGYLPEGYDPAYIEVARAENRVARLSGFSSFFMLLDEDDQEWFDEVLSLQDDCTQAYEQLCKGTADWEKICNDLDKKLDSVDFSGFIDEIFAPLFRAAAKQVRSADAANYQTDPIYLQSEYESMVEGGLLTEEGEVPEEETPAEDAPAEEAPAEEAPAE